MCTEEIFRNQLLDLEDLVIGRISKPYLRLTPASDDYPPEIHLRQRETELIGGKQREIAFHMIKRRRRVP